MDCKYIINQDEREQEYIYRICSMKDAIGTWHEVANILNANLALDYSESRYRKMYQSFQNIFENNQDKFVKADGYAKEIRENALELKKEREKLRTEKLEYNRWVREQARDELITEHIREAINSLTPLQIPEKINVDHNFKTGILAFSDCHYNAEFSILGLRGEVINAYSPEIFETRMWELLKKTVEIVQKENLSKIYVFNFGDDTDGLLRVKQLMTLRYGVLEATVKFSNFICEWLNELTKYVKVEFQFAKGNHDQLRLLNEKKDSFKGENLSMITSEFIQTRLVNAGNPNFRFIRNPSENIFAKICDFNVLGIHGEVKSLPDAIKEYSSKYDMPINILMSGHKHHYHAETVSQNQEVIIIPSIIGIDDYAMEIGKTSNAGALFVVLEEEYGVVSNYMIKFKDQIR